jgi:hypothetical protein
VFPYPRKVRPTISKLYKRHNFLAADFMGSEYHHRADGDQLGSSDRELVIATHVDRKSVGPRSATKYEGSNSVVPVTKSQGRGEVGRCRRYGIDVIGRNLHMSSYDEKAMEK